MNEVTSLFGSSPAVDLRDPSSVLHFHRRRALFLPRFRFILTGFPKTTAASPSASLISLVYIIRLCYIISSSLLVLRYISYHDCETSLSSGGTPISRRCFCDTLHDVVAACGSSGMSYDHQRRQYLSTVFNQCLSLSLPLLCLISRLSWLHLCYVDRRLSV